jgi:hypothetical protein
MTSFIKQNLRDLKSRHYIRKATSHNYWVDFASGKLLEYEAKYDRDFCLVVNHSETSNDAYVIPVSVARQLFRDDNLNPNGRGWSATIERGVLTHQGQHVSISAYYNSFDRLISREHSTGADSEPTPISEPEPIVEVGSSELTLADLRKLISAFNEEYRTASPIRRFVLSERIGRPGLITDCLKPLRKYTCQICRQVGFKQRNDIPYVEAHHIVELHELVPGSLCSDNIVIVCATCHRKLHFANVHYEQINQEQIATIINGERFEFETNVISAS